MKALITGADGFVGPYLCELLRNDGYEVFGTTVSSPPSPGMLHLDLTDGEQANQLIREIRPDYIFHLAGQASVRLSWDLPQKTLLVNTIGSVNLFEAVKNNGLACRIVNIGSSEQYGKVVPEDCPIREEHELKPENPYGVSKAAQEAMARLYIGYSGLEIVNARPFNHIGVGQSKGFVVPDFVSEIIKIERNEKHELYVGNLNAERDFTDVRDVVRGYLLLARYGKTGGVYNIGSGKSVSIQRILDHLVSRCEKPVAVKQDADKMRPLDVPRIECDNSRITALGFELMYSLEDSLDWILDYERKLVKYEKA